MKLLLKKKGKETQEIDISEFDEVTLEGTNISPGYGFSMSDTFIKFNDLQDYEEMDDDEWENWPCDLVIKFKDQETYSLALELLAIQHDYNKEWHETRKWNRCVNWCRKYINFWFWYHNNHLIGYYFRKLFKIEEKNK